MKPIAIGSRRELFVDDFLIDQLTAGARLRLRRPTPREKGLTLDAPNEGTSSGYFSVFRDGDIFRMYYRGSCFSITPEKVQFTSIHPHFLCYAESDDGIHWRKPELGLYEYEGSTANNIIMASGVYNGVELDAGTVAVFKDGNPEVAPEARYRALFRSKHPMGLMAFTSPDGFHWTPFGEKPIITHGAFDSQNVAFWDAEKAEYRAYWRYDTEGETTEFTWNPAGVRAIRTAVSQDFVTWTEEADLNYGEMEEEHLYTNVVNPYPRAPHLYLGFPMRYIEREWGESLRSLPNLPQREMRSQDEDRYGAAITDTQFMASRDGVNFKRWSEAFLRPGIERPGTWNYGHMACAWSFLQTKSDQPGAPDELSFYVAEDYWVGEKGCALRRYTLRMDGFVALEAPMSGGELLTKPLTFSGDQLRLNFSTSAVGSVKVELEDAATGEAIPGYALDECPPLFGDALDRVVTWQQGSRSRLAGRSRGAFAFRAGGCRTIRVSIFAVELSDI